MVINEKVEFIGRFLRCITQRSKVSKEFQCKSYA